MTAESTATRPGRASTARVGRPYDGTLRRERAAETRERIIVAGAELLHRTTVRDLKKLTVRAVAERAGVNERTVYRYFGNERGLRDAVMHRNEQQAGIDLVGMQLEDIATVAAQIFDHVSLYPREPAPAPRSDPPRRQGPSTRSAARRDRSDHRGMADRRPQKWWPRSSMCSGAWAPTSDWSSTGRSITAGGRSISWVIGLVEQAHPRRSGPAER